MSNLTAALRIGTTGMQLSQLALGTVSHNIVNANTQGYSRQVIQTSASSINGYGNGVQLLGIQRITDRFIYSRSLTASSDLAYSQFRNERLTAIENVFTSGGSGGLESVLGNFIDSFNNLANDPANSSLRRDVVQQAGLTASTLNGMYSDLATIASDADNTISADLNTINVLLSDISRLNTEISAQASLANGSNPNDLMDTRDSKVAELSKYFNLQVSGGGTSGALRITTENGRKLVDETGYVQLARGEGTPYPSIVARNVMMDGSLSDISMPINTQTLSSGKIKALVETRDELVPNMLAQLNEFADVFMSTVNQLSSAGTSYPAQATLSSGNLGGLSSGADLLTAAGFGGLAGASFNVSVVDSLGNVVATTVGGAAIDFTPTAPATTFSVDDLVARINASTAVGATGALPSTDTVTASVSVVGGQTVLQLSSTNPNYRVVIGNAAGDALGLLGMNNMFTGTSAANIAVRADLAANPDLMPVARMNSGGGVSSTDNQNVLQLAKLADTKLTFAAAGGLGTQTVTARGYASTLASNLAVTVADSADRLTFNENLSTQLASSLSSVSGVNINDELSQMLIYQNAFQASARIISVVNDLLDELVKIV